MSYFNNRKRYNDTDLQSAGKEIRKRYNDPPVQAQAKYESWVT